MAYIRIKQRGDNPFKLWVDDRLSPKTNNSVNIALVGETGSGKTYTGLKLCQDVDKDFSASRIAFSVEEVVKLLDSKESGLKRGSALLLEETGVSAGSRDALTNTNKTLSYIYQTIRVRGYFLVLTLPNFMFLDKQVRELQHVLMETTKIDKRKKLCKVKPLFISINQSSGMMYKKYLNYAGAGLRGKMKVLGVGLANPELIKAYEIKKDNYLDELRNKMEEKLKTKEEKKIEKENAPAYTPEQIKKYNDVKSLRDEGRTWSEVATQLGEKTANINIWFRRFNPSLI